MASSVRPLTAAPGLDWTDPHLPACSGEIWSQYVENTLPSVSTTLLVGMLPTNCRPRPAVPRAPAAPLDPPRPFVPLAPTRPAVPFVPPPLVPPRAVTPPPAPPRAVVEPPVPALLVPPAPAGPPAVP